MNGRQLFGLMAGALAEVSAPKPAGPVPPPSAPKAYKLKSPHAPAPVPAAHQCDEDCQPYLEPSGTCRACGVEHGDPCPECGATGFHRPGCSNQ